MTPVGLAPLAAGVATTAHLLATRVAAALPGRASGLDPDPGQARRWVEQELAQDAYRDRRSLLQQLVDWLRTRLDDLQNPVGGGGLSLPPFVIAGLAVLVVVVLVVLATRVRRERRVTGSSVTVLGETTLTAARLRSRARQAFDDGRYDDAVLDTVRAVAREADARTLLTDAPSLTAHEIGRQLSGVFPGLSAAVTRATDRFDAVAYGHLAATREHAEDVRSTDEALRTARPVLPDRPRWGGPPGAVARGPGRAGDSGPDPVWSTGGGG